jgi:PAS domain S-box-containing protein
MDDIDVNDAEAVKASLLENLRRATEFIQRIANGDYSVRWEGMDDRNREQNKENIAGELIKMRKQMREVKEQDRIRIWSTEGLSKFGEIIRNHQNNFDALADNLISNAVKYVEAKVGGLYILEEEEGNSHLALRACYAFERKKFITKRIDIGEGLVGQTYLEGKTVHLNEVPNEYITITSGLGETTPRSLLVIPLKVNERIEGVLELASLKEFQPFEIEFFEKLAEALAASIVTVRTAEKTKILLATSQEQSEEMRAQEEEMRQNMEEIEATQEQMQRQMTELNTLKNSMEHEKQLFSALMDNIPDAIYFKDLESKFIRVSKYLAKHFNATESELIGKSDFDFQDESHAREAFEDEQRIMKTREPKIDFVEREVGIDGVEHFVSTTKMPLMDIRGAVTGTFGISRDVSKLKRLEIEIINKDKKLKEEEKEYQDRIRMLERKISLKEEEILELKKASK